MIIGITGTDGAGKGAVVDYLVAKHGFAHCSGRAFISAEIERRGLAVNRTNTRLVANDLRREHGNDYIVQEYLKQLHDKGIENAVIESIRAIAEADAVKAAGGVLLAVDADRHLRYERISKRGSATDRVSFEEFVTQEETEMNDPDPNGMQKAQVMAMADRTILNNGTLEELRAQIEETLKEF